MQARVERRLVSRFVNHRVLERALNGAPGLAAIQDPAGDRKFGTSKRAGAVGRPPSAATAAGGAFRRFIERDPVRRAHVVALRSATRRLFGTGVPGE